MGGCGGEGDAIYLELFGVQSLQRGVRLRMLGVTRADPPLQIVGLPGSFHLRPPPCCCCVRVPLHWKGESEIAKNQGMKNSVTHFSDSLDSLLKVRLNPCN